MWGWATLACFGFWFWTFSLYVCVCDCVCILVFSVWEKRVDACRCFPSSWFHLLWHVAYASLSNSLSLSPINYVTPHKVWQQPITGFLSFDALWCTCSWQTGWLFEFDVSDWVDCSLSLSFLLFLWFHWMSTGSFFSFLHPSVSEQPPPFSLDMCFFHEGAGLGCRVFGLVHRLHLMLADWLICSFLVNEL